MFGHAGAITSLIGPTARLGMMAYYNMLLSAYSTLVSIVFGFVIPTFLMKMILLL